MAIKNLGRFKFSKVKTVLRNSARDGRSRRLRIGSRRRHLPNYRLTVVIASAFRAFVYPSVTRRKRFENALLTAFDYNL